MTISRRFGMGSMCALIVWTSPPAFAVTHGPAVSRPPLLRLTPSRTSQRGSAGLISFAALAARPLAALRKPPAQPVRFPVLLQRLNWAQLLVPAASSACSAAYAPGVIATLPRTPFAATDCPAHGLADAAGALPPTSLVAGHDKNALYGRAYSSNAADRP